MNRLPAFLLPVILASCQTTSSDRSTAEPASVGGAMASVAGRWVFSHFGPPTVSNSEAPDPAAALRPHLEHASMTISADGSGDIILGGNASRLQMTVSDESVSFIKLRVKGQTEAEDFVYDKTQKTLMMPTKLEVNDSKGILPTYFRRVR